MGSLLSLVELARNHGGGDRLATTIDGELRARRGERRRHVREADRAAGADAGAAARHGPDDLVADLHGVAVAGDRALGLVDLEPDELAREAGRLLLAERGGADELAAIELHGPAEAGLERRVIVVEIVAVERQP